MISIFNLEVKFWGIKEGVVVEQAYVTLLETWIVQQ